MFILRFEEDRSEYSYVCFGSRVSPRSGWKKWQKFQIYRTV